MPDSGQVNAAMGLLRVPPTLKNPAPAYAASRSFYIDVFDAKMVLRASWGHLGRLLVALESFLGASWTLEWVSETLLGPLRDDRGSPR